jgi:hypothetical protein
MITFKTFIRAILFFPLLVVSAPFWLPISLIQWLGTKVNPPQQGFKRLSLEEVDKALAAALEGTDFVPMDREGNIGIFGLHPHFHLGARGPLGGDRALQTGDSDFDERVELSTQIPFEFDEEQGPLGVFRDGEVRRYRRGGGPVDDLELLSRLDHRCRQALGQRIAVLTVEDGQLHGEPAAFREETFAYAPGPNDWLPICEALRYKPASSLQERLWSLVTEDPEQRVRCTVLQRWVDALRSDELVPGDWDEAGLIERLVGEALTESRAIELLEQPDRVEALAAVYWLRTHGGADCMAGLARFVNAEEVSPQGKQRALGLLDRLNQQHGALAGGGVSLVSAQEAGAVSVADEQGALSLAEKEAREVQSRKDGKGES